MRDSTIGNEFREIAQEVKRFGERCVQASREWLNERRHDMTQRDQEGRRDYGSDREHNPQGQQRWRYGRERSQYEDRGYDDRTYENRPEYSARVQRQAQGYEAGEGEYYGSHQFSERGQSPAWMDESRNWDYEGGPERFGGSAYEEWRQGRWNRNPEQGQRSPWAGSQREQGRYTSRPGSFYSERSTQPDLGYGTRPASSRTSQSDWRSFDSGRDYEPRDYGTRSVYGGESAGYGGRGSLYGGSDVMSEGRMMDRDDEPGSAGRYGSETGRLRSSRAYSTMSPGYRGLGPKNYRRSDERLTEDINERLTDDDFLDASNISVRVSDGKVTLEGTVDQRWMKHLAEDIADACIGVKEVDNRITVALGSDVLNRGISRTSATSTTTTGTTGPTGTTAH